MKDNFMTSYRVFSFCLLALFFASCDQGQKRNGPGMGDRSHTVMKSSIVQRVSLAGNIVPDRMFTVSAPYEGYIQKIYVKIGQTVKKGDPVVSIVQTIGSQEPVFPLRAPFTGKVMDIRNTEGEYVAKSTGKDFIVRIDKLDNLYVEGKVSEADMVKLAVGQDVLVKVQALNEKTYDGKIESIALSAIKTREWSDSTNIEYGIKIKLLGIDESLRPGMSVISDIIASKVDDVLVVPHEYIYKKEGKFYVINDKGEHVEVTTGTQNEMLFEIKSGVSEGDKLTPVNFLEVYSS